MRRTICAILRASPAIRDNGVLFRRLIAVAIVAGLIGGLALSLAQRWQVIPIIVQAEKFESLKINAAGEAQAADIEHDGHDHSHDQDWAPSDGVERTLFTILSNVLTAIGFALVLVALIAAASLKFGKTPKITAISGGMWGLGGFITFFVAPSFGISPELPGASGAALESRQWWWMATVICSGAGLYLAYILSSPWKWVGLAILLCAPHIYGAPHAENLYEGLPIAIADQLSELSKEFLLASGLSSLILWLVLGGFSTWAVRRYIQSES